MYKALKVPSVFFTTKISPLNFELRTIFKLVSVNSETGTESFPSTYAALKTFTVEQPSKTVSSTDPANTPQPAAQPDLMKFLREVILK